MPALEFQIVEERASVKLVVQMISASHVDSRNRRKCVLVRLPVGLWPTLNNALFVVGKSVMCVSILRNYVGSLSAWLIRIGCLIFEDVVKLLEVFCRLCILNARYVISVQDVFFPEWAELIALDPIKEIFGCAKRQVRSTITLAFPAQISWDTWLFLDGHISDFRHFDFGSFCHIVFSDRRCLLSALFGLGLWFGSDL
jgi:hypothetical protein